MRQELRLVTSTKMCGCGATGVHEFSHPCSDATRDLGHGWIAYNGGAPRGCEGHYDIINQSEYEGGLVTLPNGGLSDDLVNWNSVVYYRKVEEENLRHFTENSYTSALLDRMALDDCPKKLLVRAIQVKGNQSVKEFIEDTSTPHMKTLERKGYTFSWLQEEQRKMREAAEKADFKVFCVKVCQRVNNLCMDHCTFDPKTLHFTFKDLDVVWHNTPLLKEFHNLGGDPKDVAVIIRNTTNPLRASAEQKQNKEKKEKFQKFCTSVLGNLAELTKETVSFDCDTDTFSFDDLDVQWSGSPHLQYQYDKGAKDYQMATYILHETQELRKMAKNKQKNCREFNNNHRIGDFISQIKRDNACLGGIQFVESFTVNHSLRYVIQEARHVSSYSKWLDDKGYTFSWEKKEEPVKHVRGNRYEIRGNDYVLCFLPKGTTEFAGATLVNLKSGSVCTHHECPISGSKGNRYVTEGDFTAMLDNAYYKITHKAGEQR